MREFTVLLETIFLTLSFPVIALHRLEVDISLRNPMLRLTGCLMIYMGRKIMNRYQEETFMYLVKRTTWLCLIKPRIVKPERNLSRSSKHSRISCRMHR